MLNSCVAPPQSLLDNHRVYFIAGRSPGTHHPPSVFSFVEYLRGPLLISKTHLSHRCLPGPTHRQVSVRLLHVLNPPALIALRPTLIRGSVPEIVLCHPHPLFSPHVPLLHPVQTSHLAGVGGRLLSPAGVAGPPIHFWSAAGEEAEVSPLPSLALPRSLALLLLLPLLAQLGTCPLRASAPPGLRSRARLPRRDRGRLIETATRTGRWFQESAWRGGGRRICPTHTHTHTGLHFPTPAAAPSFSPLLPPRLALLLPTLPSFSSSLCPSAAVLPCPQRGKGWERRPSHLGCHGRGSSAVWHRCQLSIRYLYPTPPLPLYPPCCGTVGDLTGQKGKRC